MGAAEDDLDPGPHLPDVQHQHPDPVARLIHLTRNLLAARENPLGLPQVDDQTAPLEPLDRPGDELSLATLVFLEDDVPLGFTDLLDHHLLGGLCRDPSQ